MTGYILRKFTYGILVLIGVVVVVFILFQGIGDPARLVMGQTGDAATLANIRKELYLDQPKTKQLLFYMNDISPICFHSETEIREKKLRGLFWGKEHKAGLKIP